MAPRPQGAVSASSTKPPRPGGESAHLRELSPKLFLDAVVEVRPAGSETTLCVGLAILFRPHVKMEREQCAVWH